VNDAFTNGGGPNIRGAKTALDHQLRDYLSRFERATKRQRLEQPPVRWATDEHLKWLIQYQIPPSTSYRRIAGKDEKTVREGIQGVARLIGLTLRPSKPGRPKGIVEAKPRNRARA
jgi:hypothetical protein